MSVKNVIGAVSVPGARSAVAVKSQIFDYSRRKATGVSLRDLFIYNAKFDPQQRIRNAQFLHNELPIRLAQRCVELGKLPYGLPEKRGVVDVRAMFDRSFSKLVALPKPQTLADDDALVEVLTGILNDHSEVVASMALGVLEARKEFSNDPQVNERINYYLNRFFMARIGLRFLIEHHIQSKNNAPGFSGILQSDCNPTLVAQDAADDAQHLCNQLYGVSPEINIMGNMTESFTYVPSHIHYILSELLKNSLRATCTFHGVHGGPLPPVEVVIARGRYDVTIKISDRGGGIPFHKVEQIWSYCLTSETPTANSTLPKFKSTSEDVIHGQRASLSGYGCGLPLARLYAQYFGGGVDLKSLEGWGTDGFVHLNRLGTNCENLPVGVLSSAAERDSSFSVP